MLPTSLLFHVAQHFEETRLIDQILIKGIGERGPVRVEINRLTQAACKLRILLTLRGYLAAFRKLCDDVGC